MKKYSRDGTPIQGLLYRLGCANKDLWGLCAPIFNIVELLPVIFGGIRNNWYQSYNSTIIEIGAQRPQSGPIAWPILYSCW